MPAIGGQSPEVYATRYANFVELIDKADSIAEFARWAGLPISYVRLLRGKNVAGGRERVVTESVARRIEVKMGVIAGWLDQERFADSREASAALARAIGNWSPTSKRKTIVRSPPRVRAATGDGLIHHQGSAACGFATLCGIPEGEVVYKVTRRGLTCERCADVARLFGVR